VGDEDFLVASMIERCPKVMMLRELLKNALEAAARAEPGSRRVEVTAATVEGARKLRIWNTGPGMSAEELFRMCDIASSIGKEKGLDRNFGMGAKVASLPSNQHGLRYRSCQGGRVHEVTIGKREGVYGRIPRIDPVTGEMAVVVDATAAAQADGLSLDFDWTEVVLLGNRPDQDTVADPYDRNPVIGPNWVPITIYNKFFDIDESIEVILGPGIHGLKGERQIRPMRRRIASNFARHEAVTLPEGVTIHYLYDPPHPKLANRNASLDDGLVPDNSICAIIHAGEFYDLLRGPQWTTNAPPFGVTFGARHISVLLELADDFPVRPDGYRQFLRYVGGVQDHVRVFNFSALARANRPEWLIKLIEELSPDADWSRDVEEQLTQLLKTLGVKRMRPKAMPFPIPPRPQMASVPPPPPAAPAAPQPEQKREETSAQPTPPPPPPAQPEVPVEMVPDFETAPELILLREKQEIADRNLTDRAARYYPESHQLFINLRYPAVDRLANLLLNAVPEVASAPHARREATIVAEQALLLRVGRALIFGLGKRDLAQGWNEFDKRMAISSETLTIAADDIYGNKAELVTNLQSRLEQPDASLVA
jgi:hypothetical protein